MGCDPVGEQCVGEALVEIDSLIIGPTRSLRQDPRPRDAEAEVLHPQFHHQLHVIRKAVVEITGCLRGIPCFNHTRFPTENIPDARSLSVDGGSPLDLTGGRGHTPLKSYWELKRSGRGICMPSFFLFFLLATRREERREGSTRHAQKATAGVIAHE